MQNPEQTPLPIGGRKFWKFPSVAQNVFLIFALLYGLFFIIVTPPFQSPDEPEHFYRAYEISEGYFIALKQDHRIGGYLPESIVFVVKPFLSLRWNSDKKVTANEIGQMFKIPLNPDQNRFVDFPNTAIYPPFTYTPQVIIIAVARLMQLPPLLIFYLARLSSLISWIFLVYYAIKIIPGFKWFFTILALLPMSVFINSSVSGDVFINGISFLLIAYILKCAFADLPLTKKDWVVIILLTLLLASLKIVYAPLALLILIIPTRNFRKGSYKNFFITLVLASTFLTMAFWSAIINGLYIPLEEYNPAYREGIGLLPGINAHQQLEWIISNPLYLLQVITHSILTMPDVYLPGYIGIFGWLEIPLPLGIVILAYIGIFLVLFLDRSEKVMLSGVIRIIMIGVSGITISLIFFSQLLIWTHPADKLISGVQGRYLIPVFPLLLLSFHTKIFPSSGKISRVVMLFSVFLLSISIILIYRRYYVT